MDAEDFQIGHQGDHGQGNDGPRASIENEQGDQGCQQADAVSFGEVGMGGGIGAKFCPAKKDDGCLGDEDDGQPGPALDEDGTVDLPRYDQDKQMKNQVGDAVVTAQRGRGDAQTAGQDAIKDIGQGGHHENWQIEPAGPVQHGYAQGDGTKNEAQSGERKGNLPHTGKMA